MYLTTNSKYRGENLIELEREIGKFTIRVGALNSALSVLVDQEGIKLVRI